MTRSMTTLPTYTNPDGLGEPFSLYSNVARAGDMVFVAGQVGVRADNEVAGEDTFTQALQTYENVRLALESQGTTLRHVVRFVVYLIDAEDIPAFYAAREQYFGEHYADGQYPPNTLLIVQALVRPYLRIEIDATAMAR
jgi:enamine deaminase RidA (YjgF/YER057c/UK114 family)